jgi:hypothetical protein
METNITFLTIVSIYKEKNVSAQSPHHNIKRNIENETNLTDIGIFKKFFLREKNNPLEISCSRVRKIESSLLNRFFFIEAQSSVINIYKIIVRKKIFLSKN